MHDKTSITQQLHHHRSRQYWWRRLATRAAVSPILTLRPVGAPGWGDIDHDLSTVELQVNVLLMKRATREGDPWSGHMSFPGGRKDAADANVFGTAKRELLEETGLDIDRHGHYIGRLSDIMARPARWGKRPFIVSPFVFWLEDPPQWRLEPREVDRLVWVPLAFLADYSNREKMIWSKGGLELELPCYYFEGYQIWGLTLRMLDELTRLLYLTA